MLVLCWQLLAPDCGPTAHRQSLLHIGVCCGRLSGRLQLIPSGTQLCA